MATCAVNWLGPENIRRFKCKFVEMQVPGDVLDYRGGVARKYEQNGRRKIDIEMDFRRGGQVLGRPGRRLWREICRAPGEGWFPTHFGPSDLDPRRSQISQNCHPGYQTPAVSRRFVASTGRQHFNTHLHPGPGENGVG